MCGCVRGSAGGLLREQIRCDPEPARSRTRAIPNQLDPGRGTRDPVPTAGRSRLSLNAAVLRFPVPAGSGDLSAGVQNALLWELDPVFRWGRSWIVM